ncbi:outer membrane protein porin [Serpentinimonas raichei]|uniref:Outer membrane protein porin n=1 Tax=Serpentinimonas raichei TaxID=1458425 RepID=A0A060NFF6_9BURK|nr:porin [Serpentinimonas raichei]BAO80171.1 outer membrane protein porin [Serpentinimonas raichei]
MKKTLIALAALAATGATLAQSSVTIYGRMDLGTSSTDTTQVGSTPAGVAAATVGESFSLAGAEGQRTGSRLGFRGTEDLGGGLRANFVYEIGINADRLTPVGTSPANNAQTRLANLSLSGGFGTVVVGTFMNAFDAVRAFSPATANAPGGDFTLGHGAATTERFDSRTQNAIAYVSPAFSGFTFQVGTVNEEHADRKYDGMILGLRYSQGPLAAQFAFGQLDVAYHAPLLGAGSTSATPSNAEITNWALGVSYTLAPVVLSFIYEDAEQSFGPTTTREHNAWEIGARFPMGAFAPYITVGQGEITAGTISTDTSAWQIGTTYNLSTRTFVYAAFGELELDRPGFARQTDGYRIGLVHNF